jgi:hypothetical protein
MNWLDQYRNFWNMNLAILKTFVEAEYAAEHMKETWQRAAQPNSTNSKGDR